MASDATLPAVKDAPMDLRKYDQQIREARNHYGTFNKPAFALIRKRTRARGIDVGDLRDVILATANGDRPEEPLSSTTFSVEAREWNELFCFWTLDLGGQRMILKSVGDPSMGGSAYRRWLGVEEKFGKKYIAFPVLEPPESPPAPDLLSGRQLSRRLATKRRAEELADRSDHKNTKMPKTRSTISPRNSTPIGPRMHMTRSSSEDPFSSDDEPFTRRRLPKNPARRGLQNDESTPASTVSSPSALLAVTTGFPNVNAAPRKRARVSNLEGLPERSGAGVGPATAASRPAVVQPPATRLSATRSIRAQGAAQNERDELNRREAEVAEELQVFINLKKELSAIRRRKEELEQDD